MADSPHATFLAVLNSRIRAAGRSPERQRAVLQQTAREFGYLITRNVTIAPGPGISVPLMGSANITAPFVIDADTGQPQMNQFGIQFSANSPSQLFNLSFTTAVFDYERLTRVTDPNIAGAQAAVFDFVQLPGSILSSYEDENRVLIQVGASAGVKIKDPMGIFGELGVDLLATDLSVSLWRAEGFFNQIVQPAVAEAIDDLNDSLATDSPSGGFRFNSIDITRSLYARMFDPGFTQNWRNLALIELYNKRPAGASKVGGLLPSTLGGGPGDGAGSVYFELGRRTDNDVYLKIRRNGLLGSNATIAQISETYIGLKPDGTASTAPATLTYFMTNYGDNHWDVDPARGVTVSSSWDGQTGPGSKLAGTKRFETTTELNGFVQGMEEVFKGQCFAAGTPILMSDGTLKAIEKIEIGDSVAAFDPADSGGRGPLTGRSVVKTFVGRSDSNVLIGETVTTEGHPFLAADGIFRPASTIGEFGAVAADGSVVTADPRSIEGEIEVFNFEVEEFHTYVAGGFRVHNLSMKLDGTEGYVGFSPNGDALGVLFDGPLGIRIVDWAKSANVARLMSFEPGKFSDRVWDDLAPASDDAPDAGLRAFNAAVEGGIPRDGQTVSTLLRYYSSDKQKIQEIDTAGSFGAAIGSVLGAHLFKGSEAGRILGSTAFSVIGENLAELFKNGGKVNLGLDLDTGKTIFSDLGEEFASAGIGAVSSFLIAELLQVAGVGGFAGEFISSTAGSTLGKILTNISLGHNTLDGLSGAHFANLAGSFVGTKLAGEVLSFQSIGGQLGSAIGSSLGSIIAATAIDATVGGLVAGLGISGVAGTLLAGFLTAGVGAFVGFLLGGAIGSLFGGTPRSSADAAWDEESKQFTVENAYAKKSGSKDAAVVMARAVSDTLNSVMRAAGGELLNPESVRSGTYGMRGDNFVYRPVHSRDKSDITFRRPIKSETGMAETIAHGLYNALSGDAFQIAGGNVYVKRALANSFNALMLTRDNFDATALIGNIESALAYSDFVDNKEFAFAVAAENPDSLFTAELAVTLARAGELGLYRRHKSDWYGGYSTILGGVSLAGVEFGFDADPSSEPAGRLIYTAKGTLSDTIDTAGTHRILGSELSETISLVHVATAPGGRAVIGGVDYLASTAGLMVNGVEADGSALTIDVGATIDAGAGDDTVHAGDMGNNVFGGQGSDHIYGGKLDDWLIGGEGDDWLYAGNQAGTDVGGDGNYLHGGLGNDHVYGREGSDWLEGGEGADILEGGDGDDILAGGGGDGDLLKGGRGNDQYIVRLGDGTGDVVDEVATATVVRATDRGPINWLGDEADLFTAIARNAAAKLAGSTERFTAAVSADGDDAIVFGAGIEMGDLELKRSGTETAPGADLMIKVKAADGTFSEIAVKDWFTDPVKRIEWLKFADGNEIRIGDTVNFIVGTPGNDLIIGTEYNDFVVAGDGDDEVHLLGGDDFGSGGTGDDILFGGADRDIIVGGLGRDTLHGGLAADMLSGDAGGDEIDGGEGDDTVSGGRGDDLLKGGTGNDVFKFSRGDGRDTIVQEEVVAPLDNSLWVDMTDEYGRLTSGYSYDRETGELIDSSGTLLREDVYYGGTRSLSWRVPLRYNGARLQRYTGTVSTSASAAAGNDRISFEVGINVQDLVFDTSGPDLIIGVGRENEAIGAAADSADRITIRDWNGASAPAGRPVKEMAFYQAGTIDIGANGKVLKGGTAGDDSLAGGAGQDWITGGGGRDTLTGGDSDDILSGGGDDDRLEGQAGADVLYGGAGQDELIGGLGDDVLSGGDDNDMLEGGAGADLLAGGGGDDTVSYAGSSYGVTASLADRSLNAGDAAGDQYNSIENLTGSASVDNLLGDEGDNILEGGDGHDFLRGEGGDDVYVWARGDGDDVVAEGFEEVFDSAGTLNPNYSEEWSRNDVWVSTTPDGPPQLPTHYTGDPSQDGGHFEYHWSLSITGPAGEAVFAGGPWVGDEGAPPRATALASNGWRNGFVRTGTGQQVARGSADAAASGSDTLEFGEGISLSHLSFEQAGSDLIIRVAGDGGGAIRLRGQFPSFAVETLQFHDGQAVSLRNFAVGGYNAAVEGSLLVGTSASFEVLRGGVGNDVLYGGEGVNRLVGGEGDDVYEAGAGSDSIEDDGGEDTLRYVGSAAGVQVNLAAGTVSGGSAQGDYAPTGIENVTGSAYDDTLTGDSEGNKLVGLGGNNTLAGGDGADVLTALGGNDTLDGGEGDDALSGGDGTDVLTGGGGKDVLDGGAGSDTLNAGAGDDQLLGGEGGGTLDGGAGNDMIVGGSGADTMLGGEGADVLIGNGGGDTLQGGDGDDQYVFEAGSGTDTITDGSGKNVILFGGDVDRSRLWLTKDGDHLRIGIIGTDHVVKVEGFFATSGAVSRVSSVRAGEHTLFLNGSKGQALIQRMTLADGTAAPAAMNAAIGTDLGLYWTNGNTAPENIALEAGGSIAVAEGTAAIAAAGVTPRFVATDAEGDTFVWSMVNDAGGRFGINAQTGALSVLNAAGLDFESAPSHSVTIRATDAQGAFTDHMFTVAVTDRNDRPDTPVLEAGGGTVPEGSGWFARFRVQDQDGNPVLQLVDNPGGLFTVVDNEVRFAAGAAPDFEALIAAGGHSIADTDGDGLGEIVLSGTVRASDGIDATDPVAVTAVVEDSNEAPTDMILADRLAGPITERDRLATDSGPGATTGNRPALVLGKVQVADGDHPTQKSGQYTYQVFENGSATASQRFAVVNGELQLLAGKSLDYETDGASIDLRIAATDLTLAPAYSKTFTFAISDQIDVLGGDEGNNDPLTGQSGQDLILGYGGNDVLVGGAGPDTLDGGAGTDIAAYSDASGPISADLESKTVLADGATDTLISIEGVRGSAFADTLQGSSGADVLQGGAGNDLLDGRGGPDNMAGGTGNDIYVVNDSGDQITELANEGVDEVYTAMASYTLAANVEKLFGMSATTTQHLKDNALDNTITGTAIADWLYISAGGADTAFGKEGNDTFFVGGALTGADRLDGGAGTDSIMFQGNTSVTLTAEVAANIENLTFRPGTDTVYGVAGLYTYNIAIADSMVLAGAQMRVNGSVLLAGETLVFDGSAETDGSFYVLAGAGRDDLKGSANGDIFFIADDRFQANDRFDGGAGSDQLQFRGSRTLTIGSTALSSIESILLISGGAGNPYAYNLTLSDGNVAAGQTLTVDGSGLVAAEGFTLNGTAETDGTLVLKGGAGNDVLTGGAGADTLTGGLGNDTLAGGLGADQMAGGAGNDLYIVDGAGGAITELAGEGTDEVRTSLAAYTLAANVENLTSTGTGPFKAAGNALDNVIQGSATYDYFYLQDGGNDTVQAGAGNDWIYVGKALSAGDVFDGGVGASDQLALQGNYTVTMAAQHLTNIEFLYVMSGTDTFGGDTSNSRYSYDVTTVDSNVAAGARLNVDGWYLVAGENFTFNGSAETDGSFLVDGGRGTDNLTGGAGNDILSFEEGRWQAGDKVAGGAGLDTLRLKGAHSIVFAADSMSGIETIQLTAGPAAASYPYALTMNDGNVAAGQILKVDGSALRATEALTFDGSAETNGAFQLLGGAASDSLKGGSGADTLTGAAGDDLLDGRAGADQMTGGAGNDTYVVDDALDAVTEAAGEGTADHVQTSLRTYTLVQNVENLTSTVVGGSTTLTGNSADNVITTGSADDLLILLSGGKDIVTTGDGNDAAVFAGSDFNEFDRINLGGGTGDQLGLRGSVTTAFKDWHLTGVETLVLLSGLDTRFGAAPADMVLAHYNLTTIDSNVAAGATLRISANTTIRDETVRFDGRAETDGSFVMYGGGGTDTFFGGARDDLFAFGNSGTTRMFDERDKVDGGAGADKLQLIGSYTVAFASDSMSSIETLDLMSSQSSTNPYDYDVTMADGNVAAGAVFAVNAAGLGTEENLTFNGAAESNGRFHITGGAGSDIVRGGAGIDTINTGGGNDLIHLRGVGEDVVDGGADVDTISFAGVATGVTLNLGTDTKLTNVENVIGTSLKDTIKGSDSANRLEGGAGDDTLEGGKGADQIIGGAGYDTVTYAGASQTALAERLTASFGDVTLNGETLLAARQITFDGVRLSLWNHRVGTAGTGTQGEAQGDQFLELEKIIGSSFNDRLTATDDDSSEVWGGSGDDQLNGLFKADKLYGEDGDDILMGREGVDYIYGGAHNDRLFGESGDDHLYGGLGDDHLIGGSDGDTYYFKRGEGNDRIYNWDAGGFDHLSMGDDIFHRNIWFDRVTREGVASDSGVDLRLTVLGAGGHEGTVTITDWFRTGTSAGVFTVDLITDSGARATVPADVDRLIALMTGKTRPINQQAMDTLLTDAAFFNGLEEGWRHLNKPTLEGVLDISTVEPLDSATGQVALNVRAHYVDSKGLGLVIPSTNIDLELVTTNGQALSSYVAAFNPGTPDAAGNRTVVLTLTPNGSTHLLAGGKLPLEMRARLRGVVDATGALIASSPFSLTIAPTADTPTLSGSSAGGNSGTYIPVALTTDTPDKDGSEKVDVLVGGVPAGYSLTNAAGAAVGTWTGYDPTAKSLSLVTHKGATVSDKTGGVFEIASVSAAYFENSAISSTALAGDFVLRAKGVRSETYTMVGMNSDPRENTSYTSIDFGILIHKDGKAYFYENGAHQGNVALNGQVWMWRKGSTLKYGVGPDFATASQAANVFRTVENVTGTLYFDSMFGMGDNAAEVQVVETATRLTPEELSGLRLYAPAGRSQDATLNVTPVSVDGPSTRQGAAYAVKVAVNAAPTDIATRGAGTAPALNISESTATNNPIGKVVGIATAVDPDALERNLVSTDFNQLTRNGGGEDRIAYVAGPDGQIVQVLETGQMAGGAANWGGGVTGNLSEPVDSSRAYKFSVYVKIDNSLAHSFYFGTQGTLENAVTGLNSGTAFVNGAPNTLQSGRWYRVEGYVLPVGHELLASQDLLGGIFDVATGAKVANTNTYRFAPGAQTVPLQFVTWGNEQNQGFSTQWHQPQVEKLEYRYELVGTNPLFKINPVTGAIIATSSAIDYEAAPSHNVTVRVIDRSTNPTVDPVGLVKDKVVTIAVNNLNEPNSFPATPPGPMGVDENSAGAIVGTVQATDIDSSSTPFGQQAYGFWNPGAATFTSTSSDGRYVIDSATGQIRTATALNYETMTAPVSYWVAARDNNGVGPYFQAQMQISIGVRDLNEPNSLPAGYGMNVNENVAVGTAVGAVAATDLDLASTANGQQRYYFYNAGVVSGVSSDSRYAIDAVTGQIRTNAALNFEAGNMSAAYTVVARDRQGVAATDVIFRDSFEELAVPAIGHRSDGGWTAVSRVTNTASAGNGALRAGMWGSHSWNFPGSTFVATQSTVTLSVMVRDSGVLNSTVTGGWSGSTADSAHPVLLGLHNETTDAWITATNAAPTTPPNGGGWVRHVQTISGLTVGQTYTVSAMMGAYDGARSSDIDALQVEYGSVATPFVGWSQAFTTATIGINDVNEANSLPASYAMNVNENVAVGTAVGTVAATDIDSPGVAFGQQRYYFLNGGAVSATSSDGRYAIDAVTGAIRTAAALDREAMSSPVTYSVVARDNLGTGNQAATSVTIGVNDLNEVNGFAGSYGFTVAENVAVGTQVGSVAAGDPDSGAVAFGQQRYYFWNGSAAVSTSADGRYSIDAATGAIRTATAIDYEAMSAPTGYTVVARDNAGNSPYHQASTGVTIGVSNVNEAPGGLAVQSQTYHPETLPGEAGHPGKMIATFAMSDPDGAAPSLAIIGGNPYGWFTTSGANLHFAGANFTSEWLRSYIGTHGVESGWYHDNDYDGLKEVKVASLTVAAVDAGGLQGPAMTYNVFIEDKNETPVWNATPYTFGLNENPATYAYVGTVAGSDIDGPAGELRYGFADWSIFYDGNIGYVSRSPDGRFLINNHNGAVYVNGSTPMDYEYGQRSFSYSTLVYDRAAGPHALARAGTLNINLQNTNDSATYYTQVPAGFTVTENTAVGTVVSDGVRAADVDGYGISYSIDQSTNPNGAFGVNGWGQIYVTGTIDYEAGGWQVDGSGKFANLRVLASDGGTAAAETIKINIGNIRKYVYNNGALDHNLYEVRSQSTDLGGNGGDGGYEPGFYAPSPWGGGGAQGWFNEAWLVEKSTGLVLSWMGEHSQWQGTTSRPFPHAGSLAEGYSAYGNYPSPYTMYADQEDIMTGIDGVPQGQPYYPIVFDLGGNGFDLVGFKDSGITTDLNKDGLVEGSGWVKASDGFLVLDRNGDGLVLDWNEISFVKDKKGATTDLEGLVAFDSDGNLKLAAGDARFDEFRLWVDSNQDGIGQAGELRSLRDAGIVSISLIRQDIKPAAGSITANSVLATAAFERSDGTVGLVGDVALGRLPQRGPEPEPGAPKFRLDQAGASSSTPEAARSEMKPEAGGPRGSGKEGTTGMEMSQAGETQAVAAAGAAGGQKAKDMSAEIASSAQSAQSQTGLVPQAGELATRSFAGRKGSYSLTASNGGLFVASNKQEGAIDSRVQEVRPSSLLSFRNGTIGLVAPVVLDLDGDGVELKRRGKADARFDMDGNGTRDDTGWISRKDGFLVVDLDGDGRITSPAELSLLGLKADAKSGLDALAALDSDKNGSIDSKDARFGELKLWVDGNGNGVTDAGELQSLADRGIASVGLAARAAADSKVKIGRNAMLATSTFTRTDGSTGSVGDAALAFRAGKPGEGSEGALRQLALDVGAKAAGAMEDRDRLLTERLESLRSGLNSRPFLSLAGEGDDVFDRFARRPAAPAEAETSVGRMDVPELQVPVKEEEAVQAEAASVVPAADDLRLAKMVQDMASFGLRSGEGEWKNRGQTAQQFDYFA